VSDSADAPVLLVADLTGIGQESLRDAPTLTGLIIAAAGAAGIHADVLPFVRGSGSGGVAAALLHDGQHIVLHSWPERGLLTLDVLASSAADARKAVDVFARRLAPKDVRTGTRERG
jgi:S-adenosylmethionine/arginine decarboxylase-like enzyme